MIKGLLHQSTFCNVPIDEGVENVVRLYRKGLDLLTPS